MLVIKSGFCVYACLMAYILGCATIASSHTDCPFTRRLLQDVNEDDAFGDLADAASFFQEVSANSNVTVQLSNTNRLQVSNITATIEMDTGPTFSDNFLIDNKTTWEAGQTRVNVSVALQSQGVHAMALASTLTAELHDLACASDSNFSPSTVYNQTGQSTEAIFTIPISNDDGANSTVLPYLIDYDSTQSLVILDGSTYIACTPMLPPLPDFPNEWSATIESNIVNKGYSFTLQQYYSLSQNKVRVDLHSNGTDRVLIQDFGANTLTILTEANATYPHGYCSAQDIPSFITNRFADNDTSLLLSTAEFLQFNVDRADTIFVPGHQSVRGIPCEVWTQYADVTNDTSAAYNVSFYFPVSQWMTAREDYHRLLKQVYLQGVRNNTEVEHYYEYVNFRAVTQPAAVFDPCALAPKGENCNCTSEDLAALASGQEQLLASSLDGVTIDPDAVDCLNAATSSRKGFSHAQAGPYTLFALIGFAAGVIAAVAASFIWTTFTSKAKDKRTLTHSVSNNNKFQPFETEMSQG